MTLDRDRRPDRKTTGWYAPLSNRRTTILVVVAALIVVGAVIASLSLGISLF